jgi:MCP family monocarboxylic acid transporter-like MFS transporter 10
MSTGSSVGSVVWPILLANLPDKVGFGWTCRIMALICLFCGIISYLLLATRLPRKPRGAFFYRPAWRNPQYVLAVVNFWVRQISSFFTANRYFADISKTASFSFFVFQSFMYVDTNISSALLRASLDKPGSKADLQRDLWSISWSRHIRPIPPVRSSHRLTWLN